MSYGAPPPPPPPPYGAMPPGQQPPPMGPPPPNYLVWSILSTIFCCLPLGVVSIVFAAQVNSKWASGDVAGAQDSSRKAKQFAMWGTIVGVLLNVIGLIFYVFVIAAALKSGTTTNY
jgi:hypothetical protein